MLRDDFPIYFNTTPIIWALSWTEQSEVVETEAQSEAGTDILLPVRYDKLEVTAQYKCTSTWVKTFKEFSLMDSFTLKIYDPITEAYKERTVRMRNFSISLIRHSEDLSVTEGVWKVSFTLKEI